MLEVHSTALALNGDLFAESGGQEGRLSMAQAAALAIVLSSGMWAAIGLGLSWLLV